MMSNVMTIIIQQHSINSATTCILLCSAYFAAAAAAAAAYASAAAAVCYLGLGLLALNRRRRCRVASI
jgi:hypothetical protein